METNILEISEDGLEISLMDGSVWQPVNIGDVSKTSLWYSTQRIEISESGKGKYALTNLDTAAPDKIKVSKVL